jgi:lysophospholipase L1-like esterase
MLRVNVLRAAAILLACLAGGCTVRADEGEKEPVRYAAVGDSYTIGEGADPDEAWPSVMTAALQAEGIAVELVANPSVTGYTSRHAIERELPVIEAAGKLDLATLMIGVNDWVRGRPEADFRKDLVHLIEWLQARLPAPDRLVVVTIPDFSVTPRGARYARGRDISAGLKRFNEVITEEAKRHGARLVDVYDLSLAAKDDPTLVAADGLHPSAKGYAAWEKIIRPVVREALAAAPAPAPPQQPPPPAKGVAGPY